LAVESKFTPKGIRNFDLVGMLGCD
jgi:hypothetical protein